MTADPVPPPPPRSAVRVAPPPPSTGGWRALQEISTAIAGAARFVERRLTGQAPTDVFGYDPELTDAVLAPLLRPLFRDWFNVEVRGAEHVPLAGAALVVANHSGVLPWDALMIAMALREREPGSRALRLLGADLLFSLPVVADLARRGGATLACVDDAERLFSNGELVGVFPEGYRGIGKPYRERYQLQRFGRGGFVSVALRAGVPIVPCAVVGAEGAHPMLADLPGVARRLGIPYFPLTPTFPWLGPLGVVPLPGAWTIRFAPPIPTAAYQVGPGQPADPALVVELTEQVRSTVAQLISEIRDGA